MTRLFTTSSSVSPSVFSVPLCFNLFGCFTLFGL